MAFLHKYKTKPLLFKVSLFFLYGTFICTQTVWSQDSSSTLFEGPTYADIHRTINERHKFLGPYEFQQGSIYFDGIWQEGIEIKYDTYQDLLLLKHPTAPGAPTVIVNSNRASQFKLGEKSFHFIHEEGLKGAQGYFELLAANSHIALLKKHRVRIQRKQASGLAYYEFKQAPYYLYYENGVYSVIKKMSPELEAMRIAKIKREE
jgi:hypothetical protein